MNGAGADTGCAGCLRRIREISRSTLARSEKARRAVTRSPITQPQRRATDSAIADKPCPVILMIGISRAFFRRSPMQSACHRRSALLSDGFLREV